MMRRLNTPLWITAAGLSIALVGCGGAPAEAPEESTAPAEAPAAAPVEAPDAAESPDAPIARRFIAPIRGEAELGYVKPDVKVRGDMVVTTIRVKNLSGGAIAGLRIEEFWWNSDNSPLPADSQRLREPLMPLGVVDVVLNTPKSDDMARNSYKFSHTNGTIKTQLMDSIEEEPEEPEEPSDP